MTYKREMAGTEEADWLDKSEVAWNAAYGDWAPSHLADVPKLFKLARRTLKAEAKIAELEADCRYFEMAHAEAMALVMSHEARVAELEASNAKLEERLRFLGGERKAGQDARNVPIVIVDGTKGMVRGE